MLPFNLQSDDYRDRGEIERLVAKVERLEGELSALKSILRGPDSVMTGNFDFSHHMISARNYKAYLEEIKSSAYVFALARHALPVTISFETNNLTDACVEDICDFCLENNFFRENLTNLDLRNNVITKECFPKIEELIASCPKLTVDISCNSNARDVRTNLAILVGSGRVVYTGAH